jgi:threonylcarbamoyladenosine tRNA methylthiotransferase CDKAL1
MGKFYLETYGCRLNQSDSDLLRGVLSRNFQEASENEADFIIINSCGVLGKTENKIIERIDHFKNNNKKVILAGCLPLINPDLKNSVDGVIGPRDVLKIDEAARMVLGDERPVFLNQGDVDKAAYYRLKERGGNTVIAAVSISEGCVGDCSYCGSKISRGSLKSFSKDAIKAEIEQLVVRGFKEIHLTSQDAGCYGLDRGKLELPSLLEEISSIPGRFKIRLGMINPQFAIEMASDLLFIFESRKLYRFLHLPVQSGSDRIIGSMNRNYKVADLGEFIKEFKRKFPDSLIALDAIVGFPGESEEDFKETLGFVERVGPHIVHINKFSPRPGTAAANLPQLSPKVISRRSKLLTKLCNRVKRDINKKFLHREFRVLVTKEGKPNTFIARPQSFRAVIIKERDVSVGEIRKVRIMGTKVNYLLGQIVD